MQSIALVKASTIHSIGHLAASIQNYIKISIISTAAALLIVLSESSVSSTTIAGKSGI